MTRKKKVIFLSLLFLISFFDLISSMYRYQYGFPVLSSFLSSLLPLFSSSTFSSSSSFLLSELNQSHGFFTVSSFPSVVLLVDLPSLSLLQRNKAIFLPSLLFLLYSFSSSLFILILLIWNERKKNKKTRSHFSSCASSSPL